MAMAARMLLAAALALVAAPRAHAACSSAACPDVTGIENVRSLVASACDCADSKNHGAYVRCAKTIIKSAVRDARLAKNCKGTTLRCEAKSSCGRRGTDVCCAVKRGRVKAKLIRTAARCPGTTCDGQMALADACTDTGACAAQRRAIRSFVSVQQVFKTSCALSSCHSTFARQGGLVLDSEDISFASLVDRPATHAEAKQAGLVRVKPGDPANSFLIRKLRGQGPGDPMPQAGGLLAEPVIQMIEDWVARGAHSSADECRLATSGGNAQQYCNDEPQEPGDFVWKPEPPLELPPVGTGIQLYAPSRPVDAGTEWETCYAFKPNWTELAAAQGLTGSLPVIKEQTYRMHKGSHHLLLYAYFGPHPEGWTEGRYFPCVAANCENAADCPDDAGQYLLPIGGTQVASTAYQVKYPEGVGIPVLSPNQVLIANLHYTNPFQPPQPIHGEAWLNINFYAPGEFKVILDGVFAINYVDLLVEPYQSRTISRIWHPLGLLTRAPANAAVFQLFGHMHKRATEFRIDYVKDGACAGAGAPCMRNNDCGPGGPCVHGACAAAGPLCGRDSDCGAGAPCVRGPAAEDTTFYYTTAWDQAPVTNFEPPYFPVAQNEGLRWTCTHVNGVQGDPTRPPKKCHEGCDACGWTGGVCSTNGRLCEPASACAPDETCVADVSGYSPSGFYCVNAASHVSASCCPGSCTADPAGRACYFTRGKALGMESVARTYREGDPMPLVFGQLADDDMCNMFGYFIKQEDLANIGQ